MQNIRQGFQTGSGKEVLGSMEMFKENIKMSKINKIKINNLSIKIRKCI